MLTNTDLANYALALLGQTKISDIDDAGSKAARTAKQFLESTIDEVLRLHRWNCAIKRATLPILAEPPNHGFPRAFALPHAFIRLLELNGESFESATERFEIENGRKLLSYDQTAEIRYIARIPGAEFDPLLRKAVAASLAATIAIPLTSKIELQSQCFALFQRALQDARAVDAVEVGNREHNGMSRLLSRSPLINSRFGHGGRHLRDPLRFQTPY